MDISIELTPSDLSSLESQLQMLKEKYPRIKTVNIPDLLGFDMRPWQACNLAQSYIKKAIPHIRSIDFHVDKCSHLTDYLTEHNITEVLVITGKPPVSLKHKIFRTSAIELIKHLREQIPNLTIYAALDPYRTGIRKELNYAERKLHAGANGFFTQPFYDLSLMQIYAEQLSHTHIFWGVSPILSEQNRNYWQTRNNIIFPRDFEATESWNCQFAEQAMQLVKKLKQSIYFMPMRTDLETYLYRLFCHKR